MGSSSQYDLSFTILLVGDSGVGKSSLLVTFISDDAAQDLLPTIGSRDLINFLLVVHV